MSTEIENRVVQLEMNNKSLEKNSKQSIKTLEKLDKALEFKNGRKSFEDVEKAAEKCNFEPLFNAANTVSTRFSTMGIIGVRALERITDKALDAGAALVKSLTIDQITSGYSKYEQKTSSIQTLVNSTGLSVKEINRYLDQLMWFSDETSYSFTEMVNALATMSASGGDINSLIPMIQGVANATAFAGKGATEFSRVMYNLNQSYTAGYLSYMDWKSVEQAGAASKQLKQIFLDTAVAEGKLAKSQADISNFTNLLSKKVFTRDIMEKSFGYFNEMTQKAYEMIGTLDDQGNVIETASQAYEILGQQYDTVSLRAAKSAQEAKSFSEAVDATKDAVSSQWLKIFESIFGDYEQQVGLWTGLSESLYNIFASPLSDVADLIDEAFQSTSIGTIEESLADCGIELDAFKEKLVAVAKESGKFPDKLIDATAGSAESIQDLLSLNWVDSSMISTIMGGYTKALESGEKVTKEFTTAAELANRMMTGEFGNRWNYKELTKNLQEAGYDIANAQDIFKLAKSDPTAQIRLLGELTDKNAVSLENAAEAAKNFNHEFYASNSGRTIAIEGIKNILSAIGDRIAMVKKAWGDIFPSATAGSIKNAIISFHQWTETLKMGEDEGNRIYSVASKLFGVLKTGISIVGRIIGLSGNLIKSVIRIGKAFFALAPVQGFISSIRTGLSDIYHYVGNKILNALQWCENFINNKLNPSADDLSDILDRISKKLAPLYKFAKRVGSYALGILGRIWQLLSPYANFLYTNLVSPFAQFISEVVNSDDPIATLASGVSGFVKKVSTGLSNVAQKIKNFSISDLFKSANTKFQELLDAFPELRTAFENLQKVVDNLKEHLDFGQLLAIFTGATLVIGVGKFTKALSHLSDVAVEIKKTLGSLNSIIKRKSGSGFAANMRAISIAIGVLAASLFILSKIPSEDLSRVAKYLGGMMAVLIVVSAIAALVATKLSANKLKKVKGVIKPLLALSAAMLILSIASKNASIAAGEGEGSWKKVWKILVVIGGLAVELVGVTALLGLLGGKITVAAIVLMVISIAILKLAQAVKLLENIKLSDDAIKLGWIVAAIMIVGILASAITKVGKGMSGFANAALGIFAFVASIYLLTITLEKITSEGMKETWKKFGEHSSIIIPVLVTLGGLVIALIAISKRMGEMPKSLAKLGIGVFAMVGAMYLITLLFERLSDFADVDHYWAGWLGVFLIGAIVSTMAAALGEAAQKSDGGKGALKLAAAVIVMTVAIGAIMMLFKAMALLTKSMMVEEIWSAIGYLFVLGAIIGALTLVVGKAAQLGGGKGLTIIIGAVAGIVALALMMITLTSFTWSQIGPAMVGILGIAVALAGVMVALGFAAKVASKNKGGSVSLFAMMGVLLTVGASLAVLSNMPIDAMMWAAITMVSVIAAVSIAVSYLGKAQVNIINAVIAAGLLIVIFGGLYAIIPLMAAFAQADTMSLLANMGILLGAVAILVAIAAVLAVVMAKFPPLVLGLLAVMGLFLSISVMMLTVSLAIHTFADAAEKLQGVNLFSIAGGMAAMAGAMALVAITGIALLIGNIGIYAFASSITILGGSMALATISITAFNFALISLGNTISAIANAFQNANGNILGGLANLRDEFAKSAESTAGSAKLMWDAIAGGGESQNAGAMLDNLVSASGEKGSQSGSNYGQEFTTTASAAISGGDILSEVNSDSETKGIEGAQAYSLAYTENADIKIDNESVFEESTEASKTAGGDAATAYVDQFGANFNAGFDELSPDIQSKLSSLFQGGGTDLSQSFSGIGNFGIDFSGTDSDAIKGNISNFASNMVSIDEFNGAGQENTKAFVAGLVSYLGSGEASATAKVAITSWLEESFSTEELTPIGTEIATNLVQETNTALGNTTDTSTASQSIFTLLSNAINGVDFASIGNLISTNVMGSVNTSLSSGQAGGEEGMVGNFLPLLTSMVASTDATEPANTLGLSFITKLSSSLTSVKNLNDLKNSGISLGNEVNSGGKSVDTTATGSYWGEGLANGAWGWAQSIWQTGHDLAQKLIAGTKSGIKSNSPSKEAYKLGVYFDMGLINAVVAGYDEVESVAYSLGTRACDGLNEGIQNGVEGGITPVIDMSDAMDAIDNFDNTYRPTIKPRLDMSDVDPALSNMNAVESYMGNRGVEKSQETKPSTPTSFNFTQNNYSPKALSRIDIYRQTRNQFSTVKEMIKK